MPRGGRRTGRAGKSYPNRTDLNAPRPASPGTQPISAPPAKVYGDRKAAEDAQRAVPLPALPAPPSPGEIVPLDAASERPQEPVQAGLRMNAGMNLDSLDALEMLRAAYQTIPTQGLADLIARFERNLL